VRETFDIAVIGSGFAGSLFAMIARRLGRSVILIERGRHPRFAIGESSTPLANLLLEDLARRYDLPRVLPLAKWGPWQAACPHIACGLKRGFTFYHHELGRPFRPDPGHSNQLLVAASPHDALADTHWYRPDFDAFLVGMAQDLGVEYVDEVGLRAAEWTGDHARLLGARHENPVEFRARFVVDATGPRGFLHRALGLAEREFPNLPGTQSLFGHFRGVSRLDSRTTAADGAPYPPEDAAVHHIFNGGWIWVLRFNNGVSSAGVALTEPLANRFRLTEGASAWDRLLAELPGVGALFKNATPVDPLTFARRLSFRSATVCGPWWVMLPSAAGFIDPLLSTGFPLALLGIARLVDILERDWGTARLAPAVGACVRQSEVELEVTSQLVAALYANMGDFPTFTSLCMLYFAAVSFAENAHRTGSCPQPSAFLLHDHPTFGKALRRLCALATERVPAAGGSGQDHVFNEEVRRAIAPVNIAGLCDPSRRNWYPASYGVPAVSPAQAPL
jgi:FADH2 O2-dependent halogenase